MPHFRCFVLFCKICAFFYKDLVSKLLRFVLSNKNVSASLKNKIVTLVAIKARSDSLDLDKWPLDLIRPFMLSGIVA